MSSEAPIEVWRQDRVATLRIARPPLNILDLETLEVLDTTLAGLQQDPGLQVLVVRGAGERAFSAGVAVEDHVGDRIAPTLTTFHRALVRLRSLEAISVAAVDGHCLGGGLELAAVCDLVVATSRSRFGVPEIKLGCYPPVAAALLPRQLGWQRAMELLLSGRTMEAAEAERLGLVNRVVEAEVLESEIDELVGMVTDHSTPVTRLLKRAVAAGERAPFGEALGEAERIYLEELVETEDMHEGLAAFLERRPPSWRHR